MYSHPIQQLINAFTKLPSVGARTAERFVFYLLKSGRKDVGELTLALKHLAETVKSCETCWDFSDRSPCKICSDKNRDHSIICVVANPQEVQTFENTGGYTGAYHVLRGVITADDPEENRFLKIKELLVRTSAMDEKNSVTEVILAFNPDLNGENTSMYLERQLRAANLSLSITRLARGLPMGADLQYADEITLSSALKNRTKI